MEIATSIWLLLSSFVLHVQAQDLGFVSLDCGLPANSSGYTDSKTKIKYISDEGFIKAGESSRVAPEFKNNEQSLLTLRSFSRYIRNCYDISASKDTRYLIRASFLYGNYDGLNKTPKFDLYLGNTRWTTVDDSYYYTEMMHTPSIDKLSVCLINIGYGIPFISTLEFRELPYLSYSPLSYSLHLYKRYDMGSMTNQHYRFPDDPYDRVWEIYKDNNYAPLSTLDSVVTDNLEQTPAVVMQTAATSKKGIQYLNFSWDSRNLSDEFYAYLYFAELEKLQSNQFRGFNITYDEYITGPIIPKYLGTIEDTSFLFPLTTTSRHQISIFPIDNSTLPPIINALEIYIMMKISEIESYNGDGITFYGFYFNFDS
ncbi:hypothetical protein IC575_003085 [Cucumis melo]